MKALFLPITTPNNEMRQILKPLKKFSKIICWMQSTHCYGSKSFTTSLVSPQHTDGDIYVLE